MAESKWSAVPRPPATSILFYFSLNFGILYLAFAAAVNGKLNLSGNVKGDDLPDFVSKLQFTFMYQTLGVLWLIFNISYIGSQFRGKAGTNEKWIPSDDYMRGLDQGRNIMTNSLEQFLLSCFWQYILLAHLDGDQVVQFIPLMNVLFLVGRVAFWAGYPSKRVVGFGLGWWPTVAAMIYSISVFYKKFTQSKNITF